MNFIIQSNGPEGIPAGGKRRLKLTAEGELLLRRPPYLAARWIAGFRDEYPLVI